MNASQEKVSVVIPTHNRPDACLTAVRSVLAQGHPALELIVVNDHSDRESTIRLVDSLASKSDVTLLHRNNGVSGPAAARNLGVEASTGTLVAFLDDDDEWLPDKLDKQLRWFERGFELVCSNALRSSGSFYFQDLQDHEILRKELLFHNPVIFSTAVITRAALTSAGGFSESKTLVGVEDYELLLRLSDAGVRMNRLGEPLTIYNDNGQGRLSEEATRLARAMAGVSVSRSIRRPLDFEQHRATLRNTGSALTAGRH